MTKRTMCGPPCGVHFWMMRLPPGSRNAPTGGYEYGAPAAFKMSHHQGRGKTPEKIEYACIG